MDKKRIVRYLLITFAVILGVLVFLAVTGTVAHAAGLVDNTVSDANAYSKYPLENYQLPSQDKHSGRFTKNDGGGIKVDNSTKHIPFAVIVAATIGDEAAIQKILDFYDGYISKLSLRKLYDEYGNVYMVVDSELKGRIQAAVMDMIANFEIIVI